MLKFSFLDSLLREGTSFAERLNDPVQARSFFWTALPWLFLLGGIYGFCMGSYSGLKAGSNDLGADRWLFAISAAVKVPILLVATAGLCFPALYVFGIASGARIKPSVLWAAMTASLLVLGLLLVGLSPVVLFFLTTLNSYPLVKVMHLVVWCIAGISALRFFAGVLGKLDEALRKNGRLMFFWMTTFGLVGSQMGWMLRPFIGHPREDFHITRDLGGSILQNIFEMLRRLN